MKQSEPVKGTLEDFSSEFKSGQFSDCKVKCGDSVWNLHKFVLCSRCSFFKEAFTGGLQEAQTSEITLQKQDPDRVNMILEYIYSQSSFPAYVEAIETYTQLYIRADYLGLVNGCQEFYNRLETLLARGAAVFLTPKSFEVFLTEDAITRLVSCASLLPPADDITDNDASDSVSPGSVHGELMDFLHKLIDVFRLQGKAHQLRPLLQVGASSHPDLLVDLLLYRTRGSQVSQNDPNSKPAPNERSAHTGHNIPLPPLPSHRWGYDSVYYGIASGGGATPRYDW